MFTKRQVLLGALAVTLATALLTVGAFMWFLGLFAGDALLTAKFFRVLELIRYNYVSETPPDKLVNGAIGGLVRSLDDPHSVYISGDTLRQFVLATEGQFGGIGVVVGVKDEFLTVVAPIEGTPGEAAGIKSGDRIIKIDGEETRDMPLDVAVGKIRGNKDTAVELEVLTPGGASRTLKIVRANIKLQTVAGRKLEDGIGYLRLTMFNEQTYGEVVSQLDKFAGENIKALVLDLRNNPGGLLGTCVKVCGLFVPKGPVVFVTDRNKQSKAFYSDNSAPRYKLAVLVNGGSASASEIVAGAVQDTKVGVLIGTKTFGKASVQEMLQVDADSALKLTVAHYYTPNGRGIHGVGLEPDIKLEYAGPEDNQLAKAVEILRGELGK